MSAKIEEKGTPNVPFVEDFLNGDWPDAGARLFCPTADPFVKHHGALGGFDVEAMIEACRRLPQVGVALLGGEDAARYEMPLDREGDFVVISKASAVVGARRIDHDLSQLGGHHLCSHGGLSEQDVPLFKSAPLKNAFELENREWNNREIFDIALNL
ncbi:hypothetical protein LTR86_009304 [Recurvomyces mirabilis]|nr:hypothetical protein LTR86_009304 [Recurvomyces mirabilis]